jgi:hypothetical protein
VSTLVQFVGDGRARPQERLKAVLKVHAGVDPLYAQVISEARVYEDFDGVIGSLMHLRRPLTINQFAQLLHVDANHILVALQGCHSVLSIPEDYNEPIQPYHASLRDFLTDYNRSDIHFLHPVKHHARIVTNSLQLISEMLPVRMNNTTTVAEQPLQYACLEWYRHHTQLLLHECANEDIKSVYQDVNIALKTINLKWLQYWMLEAIVYVEPSELTLQRQWKNNVSYALVTIKKKLMNMGASICL